MARPRKSARVALAAAVSVLAALGAAGCGQDCCTVDSEPIPVGRAPLGQGTASGALLARAQPPGGGPAFDMVVDTASPVTILAAAPQAGPVVIQQRGFDLLDGSTPATDPRVRARFRDLGLFTLPLGPVGDAATLPRGVMGGDLMHAFSMEMRFAAACPGGAADAGARRADVLGGDILDPPGREPRVPRGRGLRRPPASRPSAAARRRPNRRATSSACRRP